MSAFGRKKKEKQLTLEEALELLKPSLAPLWYGSKPLFVALSPKEGEASQLYPLERNFLGKTWLIVFLDPTSFGRDVILGFSKQLTERYGPLGLGVVLVLRPSYSYLYTEASIQGFVGRRKIPFPTVVDKDEQIAKAMGIQTLPGYVVIPESSQMNSRKAFGTGAILQIEEDIRQTLWEFDPGLPLVPKFEPPEDSILNIEGFDFTNQDQYPRFEAKIAGNWETLGDKLKTDDPNASIQFKMRGTELTLLAESMEERHAQTRILCRVVSEGDPGAFHEVPIDQAKGYLLVSKNQSKNKEIILGFPNAGRVPVAIYGVRVGRMSSGGGGSGR